MAAINPGTEFVQDDRLDRMVRDGLAGPSNTAEELYGVIVQDMHRLYNYRITECEARDATTTLVGFCRTLLEIKMEMSR